MIVQYLSMNNIKATLPSLFLGAFGGDWFFLSHDSSAYVIIGTVCFATKFLIPNKYLLEAKVDFTYS